MGGPHGIGLAKYDVAKNLIDNAYHLHTYTDFDNGESIQFMQITKNMYGLALHQVFVKYDIEKNEFKKLIFNPVWQEILYKT